MSVKESVHPDIEFNSDFLTLYEMFFLNYFANRSITLECFTIHKLSALAPACIC